MSLDVPPRSPSPSYVSSIEGSLSEYICGITYNTHVDTLSERSHSRSHPKKDSADSDGVTAISELEGGQSRTHGKRRAEEEEEPEHIRLDL